MEKDETKEKLQQHEDAALKVATLFFGQELLPWFGIEGTVVGIAPTELVQIELHRQNQDFNLVMDDGTWKHFEFQSTNEGLKGLKRFRNYEATASYQHNVDITTYVLYSGKIKHPMTEFTAGINTYRVWPIIMQNDNADELLDNLEKKIKANEQINREELIPVMLCLLMGGETSQKERVERSLKIIHASRSAVDSNVTKDDVDKIEMVIYTMADKFLDENDMEEIRRMMKMTRLGQMILQDGIEEGRLEGKKELISKKLAKGKTIEEIAEALEESAEVVGKMIKEYSL